MLVKALRKQNWCFQRYLWQEELDPQKVPNQKVIKTQIYGVKPSGNLAEHSIRETARLSREEYPEINEIVSKDIYVDALRADQLEDSFEQGRLLIEGSCILQKESP